MTNEEAAVWTALIVAVPTIFTAAVVPIVLRLLDMRSVREREAREDRNRMFLAKATEDVAKDLRKNTALTAQVATVAQADRRELAVKTDEKLDTIHVLVNDKLTIAMRAEIDALNNQLAMMQEMVDLKVSIDQPVTLRYLEAMDRTQQRVARLQKELAAKMLVDEVTHGKET